MKLSTFYQITPPTDSITHQIQWLSGWGGYVIQSWWWGGLTHPVPDGGVPFPDMMGGTPSSHGGGTNQHKGWRDTISGMGWVGYSIPGLGYQP